MTAATLLLRRVAIFGTVAGLGTLLAWMLAGGTGTATGPRPELPVVEVPPGTVVGGPGLPRITIVAAENPRVGTVRPVVLDDGTTVPFRAVLFRGDAERALPSPSRDVERVAVTNPVVEIRADPRTRAEYEAGGAGTSRFEAPEGVLERGPGDRIRMALSGGVVATSLREGTPWTFRAPEAEVDLAARVLAAPGRVAVSSRGLVVRGRGLRAADGDRSVVLEGGAEGTVDRARGTGLDGGAADGEPRPVRFRCAGPFRILPREDGPADGRERFRFLLEREAAVAQGEGRLAADRIEIDVARDPGASGEEAAIEEIRAYGSVVLDGGSGGREIRATCGRLSARPTADGFTDVRMEEAPALTVRRSPEGGDGAAGAETLVVTGNGPAVFRLPRGEGDLHARFTGGARAVQQEPDPAGGPPVRRDLDARELLLTAARARGPGRRDDLRVRSLVADGEALLREGPRTARARRIHYAPRTDGGSRVVLDGDAAVSWPAAGTLDPLAVLGAGAGDPQGPAGGDPGALLLASPGTVVLEVPEGEEAGATIRVTGGGTLRRVVGEREAYRLAAGILEADLGPRGRSVLRLVAEDDVRFEGRGEGPAGRRYAFAGSRLTVTGSPGSREPRAAVLEGEGPGEAVADLVDEEGRPFRIAGAALHFDRESGRFRAAGRVAAAGILPGGAGPGGISGEPRRATLECRELEGVLAPGDAAGSSRLDSLDARGGVRVRTAGEDALGETLRYDRASAEIRLAGDPARVVARPGDGAGGPPGTEDRCEAPLLVLVLREGAFEEARAEGGGTFVGHRIPSAPADGGKAPPPERIEARCRGPLVHRAAETSLSDAVVVVRSILEKGTFIEKDRLEGADEVRVLHPAGEDGVRRAAGALATSASGGIAVRSEASGWDASGVSRVELDAAADRVVLEASRDAPRFRVVTGAGTRSWFRRAVYDYATRTFPETVGVTVEGGAGR